MVIAGAFAVSGGELSSFQWRVLPGETRVLVG